LPIAYDLGVALPAHVNVVKALPSSIRNVQVSNLNVTSTLVICVPWEWWYSRVMRGFRRVPTIKAVPRCTCPKHLLIKNRTSPFWPTILFTIVFVPPIHAGLFMTGHEEWEVLRILCHFFNANRTLMRTTWLVRIFLYHVINYNLFDFQ
jgi:hypothetical protein